MKKSKILFFILGALVFSLSACNASNKNSGRSNDPTPGHEHTYNSSWNYDNTYHWHDATCGHDVVSSKERHTFNDVVTPATYDAGGYTTHTCTICGYSYTDSQTNQLVHHYETGWSHDESTHWHACTDSGYEHLKSGEATHTFDDVVTEPTYISGGYTTHTCTVCGYSYTDSQTNQLVHHYETGWSHDESTHWHACTDAGYEQLKRSEKPHAFNHVVTPATYDAGGYTTHTCTVCGYSYTDSQTDQLVHNYESVWHHDESTHWHICTDSGYEHLKGDEASHTFKDVVTPASYSAGGYTTHTCTVCGYSYVDSQTDQLVHHYETGWSHDESTHWHACTDSGYEHLKSSEAAHVFNSTIIPSQGDEEGYTLHVCECGYFYKDNYQTSPNKFVFQLNSDENGYGVYGYNGDAKNITIPDTYNSLPVLSVGYKGFMNNSNIESIVIPNSVTSIGVYAFSGCSSLKTIVLSNNIGEIRDYTFQNCSSLEEISIPSSVSTISSSAFQNCSSLASITLPFIGASATENKFLGYIFGASSYSYNSSYVPSTLKTVIISDGETSIPNNAFYGCTSITSVTIPNSIISIGDTSFRDCSQLISINVPESVTSIGNSAFFGCSSLTSITIPDSVTTIAFGAFRSCPSLKTITLPFVGGSNTTNNYFGYVFGASNNSYNSSYVPSSLKTVIIGNGATSIADLAFYGCSSLTSVTISNSVTTIGDSAFRGCSSLISISLPFVGSGTSSTTKQALFGYIFGTTSYTGSTSTKQYSSGSYVTFYIPTSLKNVTITGDGIFAGAFYNCSKLTSITLSDGIMSIASTAFSSCTSLTSITIPDSVTTIGSGAFSSCTSLPSVTIPDSVTTIGSNAFYGCTSLTSVTIPDSVTSIEESAFRNCSSLTSATIPDSVVSIASSAFYGCSSLTSVTIPDSVISIGGSAFRNCSSLTSIVIPEGVTSIKNDAFYGCTSLTSVTIPDSVTTIGSDAFYGCTSLTSVTIPDSVTTIGSDAFYGCTSLTSITIPNGITEIDSNSFKNCSSLTSVTIPDSVVSIGDSAFYNCSSLTSVTIPDRVTTIGAGAFYGCSSLTSVIIPDSVTTIRGSAFYGCTSLTSVTIPDSVTSIGEYAFRNCSSLTSIVIPNSITKINTFTFQGCISLTSVTIPDTVTSIGNYAFYNCSSLNSIVIPGSVTTIGTDVFTGCSNLSNVYYGGTVTDVTIGSNNSELLNTICYYSPNEPIDASYNYWHYVNGVPTRW